MKIKKKKKVFRNFNFGAIFEFRQKRIQKDERLIIIIISTNIWFIIKSDYLNKLNMIKKEGISRSIRAICNQNGLNGKRVRKHW